MMKLAEALQLRADLQKRMAQLQMRLNNNATVQEDEQPAEDPQALMKEFEGCAAQLQELIARINQTNCATVLPQGSLTALLAKRDVLALRVGAYRDFLAEASSISHRATRSEIKLLSTVSVRDYQKKCDALSQELRELDTQIQSTNWTTELL